MSEELDSYKTEAIKEEWLSFVGQKVVDGELSTASSMGKLTPIVVEFVQRFLSDKQKVLSPERRDRFPSGNSVVDPTPTPIATIATEIPTEKLAPVKHDDPVKVEENDADLEDYFSQVDLDGQPQAAPPVGRLCSFNESERKLTATANDFNSHLNENMTKVYNDHGRQYNNAGSHWERSQRGRDEQAYYGPSSSRDDYNRPYTDDDADSPDTLGYADIRDERNDFGRSHRAIQNNIKNLGQPVIKNEWRAVIGEQVLQQNMEVAKHMGELSDVIVSFVSSLFDRPSSSFDRLHITPSPSPLTIKPEQQPTKKTKPLRIQPLPSPTSSIASTNFRSSQLSLFSPSPISKSIAKNSVLIVYGQWPSVQLNDTAVLRLDDDYPKDSINVLNSNPVFTQRVTSVTITSSTRWVNEQKVEEACLQMEEVWQTIKRRCPNAHIRNAGFYLPRMYDRMRFFNECLHYHCKKFKYVEYIDLSRLINKSEMHFHDGRLASQTVKNLMVALSHLPNKKNP